MCSRSKFFMFICSVLVALVAMLARAADDAVVTYPVTVDYGQSLEEMIKGGGHDVTNDDITADNFPIVGEGQTKVDALLLHFDRSITAKNVVKKMEEMGLRPATLPELVAYSAKHWKRGQLLVVALGSVWEDPNGDRYVPCLLRSNPLRHLDLDSWEGAWGEEAHFLAVRK